MNKKGQSLILFIFLIPIVLLFCAFIIDYGLVIERNIKTKGIVKYSLENNESIEKNLHLNDLNFIETIKYTENDKNCVIIISKVDSIFGKIIGYQDYKVETKYCK